MNDIPHSDRLDVDDLEAAVREGRNLHPAKAYRIKVANETLNFRPVEVVEPVPLGRQILEAADEQPIDEFSIFAMLSNGDFEDVRLDEPFDLRGHGSEKFIVFRTDRLFKFTIDNRQLEWGKPLISGLIVRRLAAVGANYALYLEVRGGQDREINDADIIDLSKPGIEHFITVIKETTEGLTALPSTDRAYLEDHAFAYEVVSDGAQVGVILKDVPLPKGKFDHEKADLLILLPGGYPDACPDMFFIFPWVRLIAASRYPCCADVPHMFGGKRWQRWSRHSGAWRPGVDGLHTMIARAQHAIEGAR